MKTASQRATRGVLEYWAKGGDSDTNEPLRFELPEECWMDEQPPGPPPTAGGAPPPGSGGPLVEPVEEAAEATTAKKAAKKKKEADVGAGINKKKMNAGFFDKKKDKAVLYPDGSNEGYDPENPGQPTAARHLPQFRS